jgi:hypothetical protein
MVEHDAGLVCNTLRWQLCRPIVLFNLGVSYPTPVPRLLPYEEENQLERAKTDQILARAIGLPLGVDYFYRQYERPRPAEDEELVHVPANAITSGEDLPEDDQAGEQQDAEALTEQAQSNGITGQQLHDLLALHRRAGYGPAARKLHALANGSKKKSRSWAM